MPRDLGWSPARAAASAVGGGALVCLVASLLIGAVPRVDVSGFYPVATRAAAWQWHDGAFEDRAQGLRIDANGVPNRLASVGFSASPSGIPPRGRLAAAMATATLLVDEKEVAQGRIPQTIGVRFSLDETFDVGQDTGTPALEEYEAKMPFPFTGTLTKLAVVLEPQKLSEDEQRRLHEELAKAMEAVQ